MREKLTALSGFLGSLLLVALVVVGIPVLLIAVVGNPFPSTVPTLAEAQDLLTQNGQNFGDVLLSVLAIFIWVVWAQLVIALVVEIVSTIRRVEARPLPLLPGIQQLAARIVAGLTLALALSAPIAGVAGPAASAVIVAPSPGGEVVQVDSIPDEGSSATWVVDGSVSQEAPATVEVVEAPQQAGELTMLTVDAETDLWTLAEQVYGDGPAWRVIAADNHDATDSKGYRIDETTTSIPAATTIVLNSSADLERAAAFGTIGSDDADDAEMGDALGEVETGAKPEDEFADDSGVENELEDGADVEDGVEDVGSEDGVVDELDDVESDDGESEVLEVEDGVVDELDDVESDDGEPEVLDVEDAFVDELDDVEADDGESEAADFEDELADDSGVGGELSEDADVEDGLEDVGSEDAFVDELDDVESDEAETEVLEAEDALVDGSEDVESDDAEPEASDVEEDEIGNEQSEEVDSADSFREDPDDTDEAVAVWTPDDEVLGTEGDDDSDREITVEKADDSETEETDATPAADREDDCALVGDIEPEVVVWVPTS